MANDSSRLRISAVNDVVRIDFVDRDILDEATIRQIGQDIQRKLEPMTAPKVLMCFTVVEHLSSAALGTLTTVNSLVKKKGGSLRLAEIRPEILEVFYITKLNKHFSIDESAEAALKALA